MSSNVVGHGDGRSNPSVSKVEEKLGPQLLQNTAFVDKDCDCTLSNNDGDTLVNQTDFTPWRPVRGLGYVCKK